MMNTMVSTLERVLPEKKIDIFGKDSLMNSTIPYYSLLFFMLASYFIGNELNSPYFVMFMIYGMVPLVDEVVSQDWRNPADHEVLSLLKRNWQYELALFVTIIADWVIFFST